MIGIDLYRILSSNTDITDIVQDRIFPNNAHTKSMGEGCIIYHVGSPVIEDTYEEGAAELANITFTVNCLAPSYAQSQAIYKTVFPYLVDYTDDYFFGIKYEGTVNESSNIDAELDNIAFYENEIHFRAWFKWKSTQDDRQKNVIEGLTFTVNGKSFTGICDFKSNDQESIETIHIS